MKCIIWLCGISFLLSNCTPNTALSKQEINNMGIAGSVKLYDDMKNLQPKDGMMVKIEGTSFVAYTDTAG